MQNSTKFNFSHKSIKNNLTENQKISVEDVEVINKFLDKLPVHCPKVSNETIKRIVDFARSYRVVNSKYAGHIEMNLN